MRVRIAFVQRDRARRRRNFVGDVPIDLLAPSPQTRCVQRPRDIAVGQRQVGIEIDGPPQKHLRRAVLIASKLLKVPDATHAMVKGVEAADVLARRPLSFDEQHFWLDGRDHALRDLVLEREHVREFAIEALCPEMVAGLRIDELRRSTDPVRRPAHASFEHVADAELASDLLHVERAPLVGECGVARDDEEPAIVRERRDDVLGDASAKYSCSRSPLMLTNGRTATEVCPARRASVAQHVCVTASALQSTR